MQGYNIKLGSYIPRRMPNQDAAKTEYELMQEVRKLRQELAEAKKENDFLKKQWHSLRRKSISSISIHQTASRKIRSSLVTEPDEYFPECILQSSEADKSRISNEKGIAIGTWYKNLDKFT